MKPAIAALALLSFGTAQAALVDRGGGLIYDTVLDITWLQDANYSKTSGYHADGSMLWNEAMVWAEDLSYYDSVRGVWLDDWRLPTTLQPDPSCDSHYLYAAGFPLQDGGYGCSGSEMGHLFNGDGVRSNSFGGYPFPSPSPFFNMDEAYYWSATDLPGDTRFAHVFEFIEGGQYRTEKYYWNYAMAVRDGDVAASVVPIPAAVWLFASSLGLLGWIKRKQAC